MNPTHRIDDQETQQVIKQALRDYPGPDLHVSLYVLDRVHHRNRLQSLLAKQEDLPSDPSKIAEAIGNVESHLRGALLTYLS